MIRQTPAHVIMRRGIPFGAVLLICGLIMAGVSASVPGFGHAAPRELAYVTDGSASASARIVGSRLAVRARAAGQQTVKDNVNTHLVTQQGGTLIKEQGAATGTLKCPVTMQLTLGLTEANITLSCKAKGGTLNGHGESTFYVEGTVTHFSGTLSVTKGTGKYAHATANVHMQGTMQRGNFALAATLAGTLSTK